MFEAKDLQQIRQHGLTPEAVERQIGNFRTGFPPLKVKEAASPANGGIVKLDEQAVRAAAELYESRRDALRTVKFVPASGAATRMFKALFEFVNEGRRSRAIDELLANIDRFAFGRRLRELVPAGASDERIVSAIVGKGLDYGSKPKGLILFHRYGEEVRTAVEEHLVDPACRPGPRPPCSAARCKGSPARRAPPPGAWPRR